MTTIAVQPGSADTSLSRRIPRKYLLCVISAIFWGLLAHGMPLFNKYSLYEDPSQLFGVGATYVSGRWMLDIIHRLEVFFLGSSYSFPLLNGMTSIFFISICACIIVRLLDIRRPLLIIATCGILVTSPTMAGLFGYMFTAPHYCFGYLLTCVGVLLICDHRKWYTFFTGLLLIACAIGIYQAAIPLALCLMLLWFIHHVYKRETFPWLHYLLTVVYLLAACLLFVFLYLAINKLYLAIIGASLLNYQGIDTMGSLPLLTYIERAVFAYKVFLLPTKAGNACMYPNGLIYLYWVLLGLCAIITCALLFFGAKERFGKLIQIGLPLTMLPLAVNFIFVMCDPKGVHSLMVYSHVMLPVFLIWALGNLCDHMEKFTKFRFTSLACVILLLCSMYVRIDNICYLKAEFVQAQTVSYYTTMITRIRSTKGYRDGMAVAYVNFNTKHDSSLVSNEGFSEVNIIPYFDTDSMINNFAAKSFMENWCGFAPTIDYSSYEDNADVQQMPCYPDDGSIKVVDGVVVVKFG